MQTHESRHLLRAAELSLRPLMRSAPAPRSGVVIVDSLCNSDASVVERHGESLQGIDRISQTLTQIAHVLTADDPAATVESLSLGDLREGLRMAA